MKFLFLLGVVVAFVLVKLAGRRARAANAAHTTARKQWVVDEYARRKTRQLMLGIPLGALVLELLWAYEHPLHGYMTLLWPVGLFIVTGSALFSWHNWRCPACKAHLGKHAWLEERCPTCHTPLR